MVRCVPRMTPQPDAILIAGANGPGKTTFARQFLHVRYPDASFLNADEIQREGPAFAHAVAAGRELLRRLDALAKSGETFAVETTLSSRSYVERLRTWRRSGYRTSLHFIELPSAGHAVQRVATRVAAGGHAVPEADIRRRFARGLVRHGLQAARRPVVSLVQRRSPTSPWRPKTQPERTIRNSRSCSRRREGRIGMRSTDRDTCGPAASTPARMARAPTRPLLATPARRGRDRAHRQTQAHRTWVAAPRESRFADGRPCSVVAVRRAERLCRCGARRLLRLVRQHTSSRSAAIESPS